MFAFLLYRGRHRGLPGALLLGSAALKGSKGMSLSVQHPLQWAGIITKKKKLLSFLGARAIQKRKEV